MYTHHGYHIEQINFDESHWTKVKENLIKFWQEHLAPRLIQVPDCSDSTLTRIPLSVSNNKRPSVIQEPEVNDKILVSSKKIKI